MKPLLAVLMLIIAGLVMAPASVLAAPPANDDFADREPLPGSLPIEITRSNVEATKEAGEQIPGLAPAGHSIWFEWEAPATDWVTIGSCQTGFPTILGVFTGTEIDKLTPAASGNASEGPDCPFTQRQYSFKAIEGTKYVIAVDGNMFTGPETVPVQTEGNIVLRLVETPPPANDNFENATPVAGSTSEEPGGNRFYFASIQSGNTAATLQPGEPDHGPGSGASVWYSWTAPEAGSYRFGLPCCGTGLSRDVYLGSALGGLTPLLRGAEGIEAPLAAGATVKIAVYGGPDAGAEEPRMGSFQFFVSAILPVRATPPTLITPVRDTIAPQTTMTKSTLLAMRKSAKFWFSSSEASTFLCRLDKRPFKPCKSPRSYQGLKAGRHTFKVKAVDAAGNIDPTPAVTRIRLPERRPHR
jgi:hypothetical protein